VLAWRVSRRGHIAGRSFQRPPPPRKRPDGQHPL